jgi:hypothetical protein
VPIPDTVTRIISSLDVLRAISTSPPLSGGFGSDLTSTAFIAAPRPVPRPKVPKAPAGPEPPSADGAPEALAPASIGVAESARPAATVGSGCENAGKADGAKVAAAEGAEDASLPAAAAGASAGAEELEAASREAGSGGAETQAKKTRGLGPKTGAEAKVKRVGGVLGVGARYMWELGLKSWSEEEQRAIHAMENTKFP